MNDELPMLNTATKEAYEAGVAAERARAERYRRRAFAMRRALVRFRTAVLNDACDACFCWFKSGRRVLFGRL